VTSELTDVTTTTMTGDMTDEPAPGQDAPDPTEPDPDPQPLTAAQRASLEAAKAAKKARKAQRQAEKAQRLADEYARLADADTRSMDTEPADPGADPEPIGTEPIGTEPVHGEPIEPSGAQPVPTRVPLIAASALLVSCLVFAVLALVVHVQHTGSATRPASAARDDVLISARQDIVVLNSLDYRHIDDGLHRWLAASAGALHVSFQHVTAADRKRIASAAAVTTARILEAAVVSLDVANGRATVIASVELTVTPRDGKAVTKRERQSAEVTRVAGVWKVSALQQVGVTVQ
jgi:Mce-associated membrane protein